MEHLTPVDAGFLEVEDSDPHVNLAIGGVAVIEGPIPDRIAFMEMLAQRVAPIPVYHRKIRQQPFDLGPPEWVEDDAFDLGHHVRWVALPAPGDDDALFALMADEMSRRLDRDRPLWECIVVEGLAGGRWATLVKVHHCIADGITASRVFASMFDEGGAQTFADRINPAPMQHDSAEEPDGLGLNPFRWSGAILRGSLEAAGMAVDVVRGAAEIVTGVLSPADSSSLVGPIAAQRRFAAARVALDDVTTVCHAFGVTINDVALAAISDGYRMLLERRGETPHAHSLRTIVPASVRRPEDADVIDNRVSVMVPFLPVDLTDPVERLQVVHQRLRHTKDGGQKQAANSVVEIAKRLPFPVSAWAVRTLARMPQRGIVSIATNVPGPRTRMRLMDREVVEMLPFPPIALGLRTAIAIFSYADTLLFGISGDFDTAPDITALATDIENGIADLVKAAVELTP